MKKTLKDIRIYTGERLMENGFIEIEDGVITRIGEGSPETTAEMTVESFEGKEMLAMPGFINTHTHTGMAALRGIGDDLPFEEWLFGRILPNEDKLDGDSIYLSSMISMMEMARNGITSFVDMYMFLDDICRAVEAFGMRGYITRGLVDEGDENGRLQKNIDIYDKWNSKAKGRINIGFGPHSPYMCSMDYLKEIGQCVKEQNSLVHIHLKESKRERDMYTFREIAETGLFENKTIAAHCVHVTDDDIEVMKENGITPVNNPSSNLKLANGIAPVRKFINKGLNVALGTDSVASNNSLDLWKEMYLSSLVNKGNTGDPETIPVKTALDMATKNAARAVGWKDTGELKEGYKADITFVDTSGIHYIPENNLLSNVVYSGRASDVVATMVDGEWIYFDGDFPKIDQGLIKKKFREFFVKFVV